MTLESLVNHYATVSAADAQSGSWPDQLRSFSQSFYRIRVVLGFGCTNDEYVKSSSAATEISVFENCFLLFFSTGHTIETKLESI